MLARIEPRTPRPHPPAKARRSNMSMTTASSPPPPYMDDHPFPDPFNDTPDPVRATAQMLGVQLDSDPELSPTILAEVNDKSREELANLFLEAEKVIRAREAELAVAANIGKTLLETNQALKRRYDVLLSRLPVMQDSLFNSPEKKPKEGTDAWSTDDEVPTMDNSFTSPTKSNSSYDGFTPSHRRRISASPSALIALSETNGELIAELTRLREWTETAQVDGASRLRKLEREISGLKTELEATQKANLELEEHMNAQRMEEKKQEWQDRMQRLRELQQTQGQTQGSTSLDPLLNFAPPGHGPAVWDSVALPYTPAKPVNDQPPESSHLSPFSPISPCDSATSTHSRSSSIISASEQAVVTQLYRKVEELQSANRDLRARNQATHEQFARAERNALEIKRVYDTIRDELGSDADEEMSDGDGESSRTIRTKGGSFRLKRSSSNRSLKSITPKSSTWGLRPKKPSFEDGTQPKSKGRALGNKHMLQHGGSFRVRKPLTESLFIPPNAAYSSRPGTPSTPQRPSSPLKPSSRQLKPPKSHSKLVRRSLGSELGDEFPSPWDSELSSKPVASAALEEARALEDSFEEIMERLGLGSPNTDDDEERNGSDTTRAVRVSATEGPSKITRRSRAESSTSQLSMDRGSRRERALQRLMTKWDDEILESNDQPKQQQGPLRFMDILRQTSVEALVEIWIILQFIVVICFFVYTMTKRGPREVMGIPPKNKRQ
ncbi:hypothetical protein M422DRAFT_66053 [Sphaerobolus stellatus SS14]|nr:hypothetical protein M422DRAFT_66053 [Sphaerobolus stellatus SS14]